MLPLVIISHNVIVRPQWDNEYEITLKSLKPYINRIRKYCVGGKKLNLPLYVLKQQWQHLYGDQ